VTPDATFGATVTAIRAGDAEGLRLLLAADPSVAASGLGGPTNGCTVRHVFCDWPGYFPNGSYVSGVMYVDGAG
jgi:hypothetical protein